MELKKKMAENAGEIIPSDLSFVLKRSILTISYYELFLRNDFLNCFLLASKQDLNFHEN